MALPIPNYRDIVELIKKGATIEAQEKIMELREAALALQEENFSLREALKKVEAELVKQRSVRFEKRVYWIEGDSLPYCPYCYESQKKLYHLSNPQAANSGGDIYLCPHCGSRYFKKDADSEFTFSSGRRNERH